MATFRSVSAFLIVLLSVTGCLTYGVGPLRARITLDGEPIDPKDVGGTAGFLPGFSVVEGRRAGTESVGVETPAAVASFNEQGVFEGPRVHGRGSYIWWLRVQGSETAIVWPTHPNRVESVDLEPRSEPILCEELLDLPAEPGWCDITVRFEGSAPLPDEATAFIGGGFLRPQEGPVEVLIPTILTDGVTPASNLVVAAVGYRPFIECVFCGSEVTVTFEPHDISLPPRVCSLMAAGRTDGDRAGGTGFLLFGILLAALVIGRRRAGRRRACTPSNREGSRPS